MNNKFKLELATPIIAELIKGQLSTEGKDVFEHFIEVLGKNDSDLLSLCVNSTHRDFKAVEHVKVGDYYYQKWSSHTFYRYIVVEIDPQRKYPIRVAREDNQSGGDWYNESRVLENINKSAAIEAEMKAVENSEEL